MIKYRLFKLHRIANIPDGIFGVLKDDKVPFCLTLENNNYYIPDGTYICIRVNSPKFGNTFEITGVKNRTHILFHWGNIEEHSEGCVILGEQFEPVKIKDYELKNGVLSSKIAFAEFLKRTKGINEFKLKIKTKII
jgi:hypothetical protein